MGPGEDGVEVNKKVEVVEPNGLRVWLTTSTQALFKAKIFIKMAHVQRRKNN
jgi:hypothetical protein